MPTEALLLGPATGLAIFLAILAAAFLYVEITRTPGDPKPGVAKPAPKAPPTP